MKTVIEMAGKAGLEEAVVDTIKGEVLVWEAEEKHLKLLVELVRADEREAVLHLAISHGAPWSFQESIRARSNT